MPRVILNLTYSPASARKTSTQSIKPHDVQTIYLTGAYIDYKQHQYNSSHK